MYLGGKNCWHRSKEGKSLERGLGARTHDEIWSSAGGFGLADFICSSSIPALPVEILTQAG